MSQALKLRLAKPLRPEQIIPLSEWWALADIGRSTGYRLIAKGEAPPIIKLSDGRRGVRVADHTAWCERRIIKRS